MRVITTDRFLRLIGEKKIFTEGYSPDGLSGQDTYAFHLGRCRRQIMSAGEVDGREPRKIIRVNFRLDDEGFVLHPGQFALFETAESIRLGPKTMCWLSTHPAMAQLGLDFLQSSFLVPPGSEGRLTLETSNRGPCAVRLFPGMKVVKAVFYDIG